MVVKELYRTIFGCRMPSGCKSSFVLPLLLGLMLFATGCAKLPSATSPVGGGSASGKAITQTAQKAIGVPYRLGGTSPQAGFDCSGLVCWTYDQHGISLPRTAQEQASAGSRITKSQLQPGDLVVFKISNRRGYHSGIYTGNGKFIHSPSRGDRVREDVLDSEYWKPKLIATRRLASKK